MELYTWISIVALVGFIAGNMYFGLPWYCSVGLVYGLVLCIKSLV